MRKSYTAGVLVVGMALGSLLTMVLNPVGAASALVGAAAPPSGSHTSVLQQALDTLVGKGTITKDQAQAVTNQVQNDRAAQMAKQPRLGAKVLAQVAFMLKMSPKDLVAELRTGHKSIADVASEKGVAVSAIASSLNASITHGIDARVSEKKLKQEWATTMEQNLSTRINTFLNRTWGEAGGRRGRGQATPNAAPSTSAPATSTTTSPPTSAPTTTAPGSSTSSSSSTSTTSH